MLQIYIFAFQFSSYDPIWQVGWRYTLISKLDQYSNKHIVTNRLTTGIEIYFDQQAWLILH